MIKLNDCVDERRIREKLRREFVILNMNKYSY